jgi:hypothetical protein
LHPGQSPRVSNVFQQWPQASGVPEQYQRLSLDGSHAHLGQRIRPPSRVVTAGSFFVMTSPTIMEVIPPERGIYRIEKEGMKEKRAQKRKVSAPSAFFA